jgi:hypothetical protein
MDITHFSWLIASKQYLSYSAKLIKKYSFIANELGSVRKDKHYSSSVFVQEKGKGINKFI